MDRESQSGRQLCSATFRRQTFEKGGMPCRHRLGYCASRPNSADYITYVAAQTNAGWELVCQDKGWLFFRKPLAQFPAEDRQLARQMKAFLEDIGYIGFANFDFKLDSRDGQYKLFEMNPRQGRSSYFVTAEGYNLAQYMVEDILLDKPVECTIANGEALWTLIPKHIIFEYVSDPELRQKARELIRRRKMCKSLMYKKDWSFRRWIYFHKNQASYFKKYARYFGNKSLKD